MTDRTHIEQATFHHRLHLVLHCPCTGRGGAGFCASHSSQHHREHLWNRERPERGGVIPAVKVVALNTRTGVKDTTTTDSRGFTRTRPAYSQYEIQIEKTGFQGYKQTGTGD